MSFIKQWFYLEFRLCLALTLLGCSPSSSKEGDITANTIDSDPNGEFINDEITVVIPEFDFLRPAGIYLLGKSAQLSEIRDYSFVDGFVLRESWSKVELSEGVYDFSKITNFVTELDAINQNLTLVIFSQRVPDYLTEDSQVTLYEGINNNNGTPVITAVPWDPKALLRYQIFIKALGDHKVMNLASGTEVALRDHPVLKTLGSQIMGLGGIRDPGQIVVNTPGYERVAFTEAALTSLNEPIEQFPDKFVYVAFFGMADSITTPELSEHLMDNFNLAFNSDDQPQLGVFAENLACDTPTPDLSNVIGAQQYNTYTMFQMLQAWQDPFANPERTDICDGPAIGMKFAFDNFNARYFEVYSDDLDYLPYQKSLQAWHDILEETTF